MKTDTERRSRNEQLLIYGSAVVLVIFAFWLTYQFVEPAPPKSIRIATGSPENAYYRFALQYQDYLQKQGIELEVVKTKGSVENLELLRSNSVDIAFVQGGVKGTAEEDPLVSLASLYYEPLWLFVPQDRAIDQLAELKGKRVIVGGHGSGTRPVALTLLNDNDINGDNTELLALSGDKAVEALPQGLADALFTITSPESPRLQQLLRDERLQLVNFDRASGYRRLHPFLSSVVLPTGVIDMAESLPATPINMLAPAATLVVREDFHPALAVLMLQAATHIHGTAGLFEEAGEFPSSKFIDYPLHEDAQRFLTSGPPFLQRYLPFWAANLVDRLVVMLVPLLTLLIPLAKILPPTYSWRIRSRIYRWYDQLRDLDFRTEAIVSDDQARQLLTELEAVEKEVMQVTVPQSYADNQYNLRLHIRLIRDRIERQQQQL